MRIGGPTMTLIDKWLPTSKNVEQALKIVTHETLHELINGVFNIQNTTFTEALFDVLCGRKKAELWFAQQCFNQIKKVV